VQAGVEARPQLLAGGDDGRDEVHGGEYRRRRREGVGPAQHARRHLRDVAITDTVITNMCIRRIGQDLADIVM
jgi:hypothetical protein